MGKRKAKQVDETAALVPGADADGAPPVEFQPRPQDYRVERGAMSQAVVVTVVADLDTREKLGKDDLTALMSALSSARCGWDKSPHPMRFAVFTGSDCALVRRHLRTLKPSEMLKAVLAATHIDAWGERHPTLKQILARADHFVGLFEARNLRPNKARATVVFLDVYAHAEKLAVDEADEWARVRRELSFMQPADIMDHARRMAAIVDGVRGKRGEQPLAVALGLPELRQVQAGEGPRALPAGATIN